MFNINLINFKVLLLITSVLISVVIITITYFTNTINISITDLQVFVINVIETLALSVFLWFLVIGLSLLLTIITIQETKRNSISLFFMILIIICIGKYTDIYNFAPLHCAGNPMDFNLPDRSKEIVNEASSSTLQAVTEASSSTSKTELAMDLKLKAINEQFAKYPNLYDMPKKD
jgi:hypothetical protein